MSVETVPKDLRNLRCCLLCSLVKQTVQVSDLGPSWSSCYRKEITECISTFEQFELDGCDNCDEYLHMKNNTDAVYDCTSSNFDGIIAQMGPEDSWVAKWQRIDRFVKGCYAISVTGRLPPGIIRDLKRKGIPYRPRDVSLKS